MKKLALLVFGVVVAASVNAADQEDKNSATVDHSKNPITGTKTTTKEWKHKKKGAHGKVDHTTTETTKEKTDGTVEKKTEVENKSDAK